MPNVERRGDSWAYMLTSTSRYFLYDGFYDAEFTSQQQHMLKHFQLGDIATLSNLGEQRVCFGGDGDCRYPSCVPRVLAGCEPLG